MPREPEGLRGKKYARTFRILPFSNKKSAVIRRNPRHIGVRPNGLMPILDENNPPLSVRLFRQSRY